MTIDGFEGRRKFVKEHFSNLNLKILQDCLIAMKEKRNEPVQMAKILCFFHLLIQETVVEDDSNVQDMLIQEISEIFTNCKNYLSGSLQSVNN